MPPKKPNIGRATRQVRKQAAARAAAKREQRRETERSQLSRSRTRIDLKKEFNFRKKFLESGVENPSWQFYSLAEPAYRNTSQGEPSTSGADRNCDDEDDYEDRLMPCEVIITENESSNVTGLDVSDMDSRSFSRSHRSRSHSESSEVGGLVMNCESEDVATDPSGERPPSNNSNHTAPYRKKQKIPREDILEELLEEVRESNRIAKQHDRQVIALLKEEVELHKQELESQKRFFALLEAHYISK